MSMYVILFISLMIIYLNMIWFGLMIWNGIDTWTTTSNMLLYHLRSKSKYYVSFLKQRRFLYSETNDVVSQDCRFLFSETKDVVFSRLSFFNIFITKCRFLKTVVFYFLKQTMSFLQSVVFSSLSFFIFSEPNDVVFSRPSFFIFRTKWCRFSRLCRFLIY